MDSIILPRRLLMVSAAVGAVLASAIVAQAQTTLPDGTAAKAVQSATSSLLTNPPCTPDKAQSWVAGFRTLYCSISPYLGISRLEQFSGVRVFLSGPHDRQPNWKANTFGHYNPAFVTWATASLLPEKRSA